MSWSYGARTVTVRYEEVKHRASKRGACPVCGKSRTRSTTFTNTISPFNKDPDTGLSRTRAQIVRVLAAKAEAWVPDFTCQEHL